MLPTMSAEPLLKVQDLSVTFRTGDRETVAAQGVSYELAAGEVLAVVGESGSGKSVSALALTRLLPPEPSCSLSGSVKLAGVELLGLTEDKLAKIRGGSIAYIFQEPGTSLNPVYTIGFQIGEAVALHRPDVQDVKAEVIRSLAEVHINDPERVANQYPHELSGGMQQRAMIAMALACNPKILVADEPTTALDVTIQKEIMDLLARLRRERGMSIVLITHNFGIIANFADKVAVMWKGRIVESGPVEQIMRTQSHPYTKALIACIPRLGQRRRRLTTLSDELKVSR
ncbi:MAG: peptide transporter ATP-binding protein [Verrucomicrobiota bacterium]|jgi:ABC-type dipeptide/oligopeptide/nickel transport system ATPase component